jgi:hypothetical protein
LIFFVVVEYLEENLTNHSSTSKSSLNKNQLNSSLIDSNNPFLCAPFHLSPSNKQSLNNLNRTANFTNSNICDLNSIVTGKRTSAFVPYQKRIINTENHGKYEIIIFKKIFRRLYSSY